MRASAPLTERERELAGRDESVKIARGMAKRLSRSRPRDYEDFLWACFGAIVTAAKTWDPDRPGSMPWGKFLCFCCAQAVGEYIATMRPYGYRRSSTGEAPPVVTTIGRSVVAPESDAVVRAACDEWEESVRAMCRRVHDPRRADMVADLILTAGASLETVAEKYGVSPSHVSVLWKAAVYAWRKEAGVPEAAPIRRLGGRLAPAERSRQRLAATLPDEKSA